jgi:DNA-binding NarL/FixJ family response regulator
MKSPRLVLADDHTLVAEGIRRLLEPEFEIVGTVQDGQSLVIAAQQLKPDAVMLDISLPVLNGIEAARRLQKSCPEIKIIVLTVHADRTYATEAFRAGVSGYLLKRSTVAELCFAIREVLKGHFYVSPLIAKDMLQFLMGAGSAAPESGTPFTNLTGRQREVLQLVAEGRSNKEIACILDLSTKTVEFHKARIMRQLGIHSTAEITRYAIAHGIVPVA